MLWSVGGAEVTARLSEGPLWWESVREEQAEHEAFDYRQNFLRLRDEDYAVPRPPNTHRTMVFGDSFTFGIGVRDEADVFCEILERRFAERPPREDYERFEILNGGIPGSLTGQWVKLDERITAAFDPQTVLAVFFLRDGTDLTLRNDFFAPVREGLESWTEHSFLARHSALWRWLQSRRRARELSSSYLDAFQHAYFGSADERAEWERAKENLRTLRDRAVAAGRDFHLIVFPVLFGLRDADYPFQAICDEVARFAAESGMKIFSLLPAFRGQEDSALWVSAFDQHPNERGHAIAADALETYLRAVLAGS